MGAQICRGIAVVILDIALQPQAARDAEGIFAYLAQDNIAVARRFNEAVADTLIALRDDPKQGMAWHASSGRLTELRWKRIRRFKKYLIFYRIELTRIVVVRILHSARDLDTILG